LKSDVDKFNYLVFKNKKDIREFRGYGFDGRKLFNKWQPMEICVL